MKIYLSLIVLLTITAGALAQKPANPPLSIAQQFVAKKQQLVDDFELQMREVQYPGVRVYIRYKLAEWLWKKGRDDTERAEVLAVKALEEAYAKKDELTTNYRSRLIADLLGLLDTNAKETATRLRSKYDFDSEDELFTGFSQFGKKDGDKAIAEKLLRSLAKPGEIDRMANPLINSLRTLKSPQFPIVLGAFLTAVESGRLNVNNFNLYQAFVNFNDPQVSPALKARYFALVVARARTAIQSPDGVIYQMLHSAINTFGDGSPELLPEAAALKTVLANTETAIGRARREAEERIEASTDKLAAYIDEAEKAEYPPHKNFFYMRAVLLAKETGKLSIALEIVEKVRESDKSEFGKSWTDQEFGSIARTGFEKGQVEIALIAIDRIEDTLGHAEAWRTAAEYFNGKKDAEAAIDAAGRMLKLLAADYKVEGLRAQALIRALPVVQQIDRTSMPDANLLAAKAVNDLPNPGPEDKPGTKKFIDYVTSIMWFSYSFPPISNVMIRKNKGDVADLAERIQRKEVRIVADLVLAMDALDTAQKEAEKKAAEKLKAPAAPRQ
jgi:hypothetical protein